MSFVSMDIVGPIENLKMAAKMFNSHLYADQLSIYDPHNIQEYQRHHQSIS